MDQTQTIKQKMANAFEDIRQRLEKKEREMMSSADAFMDSRIKECEGINRILNGRIHTLQTGIDHIKDTLTNRDEAGILDYFALEFPKIAQSTDSDLPQLKEISE